MQTPLKKIALVTGANKGLGFEAARQLAASGCTVLLGARNQARVGRRQRHRSKRQAAMCAIFASTSTIPLPSRPRYGGRDRFRHLDILSVNNAVIAAPGDGMPSSCSLEAIERDRQLPGYRGSYSGKACCAGLPRRSSSMYRAHLGSLTKSSDPDPCSCEVSRLCSVEGSAQYADCATRL